MQSSYLGAKGFFLLCHIGLKRFFNILCRELLVCHNNISGMLLIRQMGIIRKKHVSDFNVLVEIIRTYLNKI